MGQKISRILTYFHLKNCPQILYYGPLFYKNSNSLENSLGIVTLWEIDGEVMSDFIFGGSKITADISFYFFSFLFFFCFFLNINLFILIGG